MAAVPKSKTFAWNKPVVPVKKAEPGQTMRRMKEHRTVSKSKSTLVQEYEKTAGWNTKHVNKGSK